jgi:hypothetical protein
MEHQCLGVAGTVLAVGVGVEIAVGALAVAEGKMYVKAQSFFGHGTVPFVKAPAGAVLSFITSIISQK